MHYTILLACVISLIAGFSAAAPGKFKFDILGDKGRHGMRIDGNGASIDTSHLRVDIGSERKMVRQM
jgi:hypothetical protein